MQGVYACNQYIDAQAPWALRKTDPARMTVVLGVLVECIARLAVAIQPVVPESAARLLDQMGIPAENRLYAALLQPVIVPAGTVIAAPAPIFPRLDLPEVAA